MDKTIQVVVPDIGDFDAVPVIEILVKEGDVIQAEDALITLESDKATMDIPAPYAGIVGQIKVKIGASVSAGDLVCSLTTTENTPVERAPSATESTPPTVAESPPSPPAPPAPAPIEQAVTATPLATKAVGAKLAHASPSIRAYARQLGADLTRIQGTGRKNRITRADINNFVKQQLAQGGSGQALSPGWQFDLLPWPDIDFSRFGPVEAKPLSRIKKISGANLARNWIRIPHVTQHESADITAFEAFRQQINKESSKAPQPIKLTMLALVIAASIKALKAFPDFNSSLQGDTLICKQYYHIGFAADTPNGLMVPVIRDADQYTVLELAEATGALAAKARAGKLTSTQMQGGTFSISSLGGIGGTAFTPIINAPEVAILGLSRSQTQPKWTGSEFLPALYLPLSLSYDHRVIDGAAAARFCRYLADLLEEPRRLLL